MQHVVIRFCKVILHKQACKMFSHVLTVLRCTACHCSNLCGLTICFRKLSRHKQACSMFSRRETVWLDTSFPVTLHKQACKMLSRWWIAWFDHTLPQGDDAQTGMQRCCNMIKQIARIRRVTPHKQSCNMLSQWWIVWLTIRIRKVTRDTFDFRRFVMI